MANRIPYRQWGRDLDAQSIQQMERACALPVAVAAALMPDAHVGYGLPIGGVLATDNAVIPYAVGVDIACRMKLTVLDLPLGTLRHDRGTDRLKKAISAETRFGLGARFKKRRHHPVLDRNWSVSPVTRKAKDKAWSQLGTSGSGNHFVEFGELNLKEPLKGLDTGTYLALLSHSGSRGTGAMVASHYSRLAMSLRPELSREQRHLAWLDLDTEPGQEYWAAMELMGHYAEANHACIHRHVAGHLGAEALLDLENHHNFAWKERIDVPGPLGQYGLSGQRDQHGQRGRPGQPGRSGQSDQRVLRGQRDQPGRRPDRKAIVHRKGATPAGPGVLGIIPGSMASPAFVVRGKGSRASMNSAAHGAGRVMSRKRAIRSLDWQDANRLLREKGVTLMSAGLDEVPFVYKNIEAVMAAQTDLVEVVARFEPRLVKMAPAGERPED